jgi:pterin-4a-carbinolamine dehydratase
MSDNWVIRKRPARLERRIEFSDYEQTRDFLDRAATLAESQGYYPDMSFGRTHVCITLNPQSEADEVSEELLRYAHLMDALLPAARLND